MSETSIPITHNQMKADLFDGLMTDIGRIYVIELATQFATGHPSKHDCDTCNERRGEAVEGTEPWTVRFFLFSMWVTTIDFRPIGAAFIRDQALFAFRSSCGCLLSVLWPNEKLWADNPMTNLDGIEGALKLLEQSHVQPGCKRP